MAQHRFEITRVIDADHPMTPNGQGMTEADALREARERSGREHAEYEVLEHVHPERFPSTRARYRNGVQTYPKRQMGPRDWERHTREIL